MSRRPGPGAAVLAAGLALALAGCGSAHRPAAWGHATSGDLRLTDGWVSSVAAMDGMPGMAMSSMPSVARTAESAIYLTISDRGGADALVSVSTAAAGRATLHDTVESANGSSGTMVPVDDVPVPAHGRVSLRPGGYHVMLTRLRGSFAAGTSIPVTLRFRSGRTISTRFPVVDVTDRPVQP